jgi:hypothetical protein
MAMPELRFLAPPYIMYLRGANAHATYLKVASECLNSLKVSKA